MQGVEIDVDVDALACWISVVGAVPASCEPLAGLDLNLGAANVFDAEDFVRDGVEFVTYVDGFCGELVGCFFKEFRVFLLEFRDGLGGLFDFDLAGGNAAEVVNWREADDRLNHTLSCLTLKMGFAGHGRSLPWNRAFGWYSVSVKHFGKHRTQWVGPLLDCPNREPHAWRDCRGCKNAYMRMLRRAGNYGWRSTEKTRARAVVNMAVKRGTLKRQPCEICSIAKVEAHHPDYSKPRDVRWLCRRHHKLVDLGLLILGTPAAGKETQLLPLAGQSGIEPTV